MSITAWIEIPCNDAIFLHRGIRAIAMMSILYPCVLYAEHFYLIERKSEYFHKVLRLVDLTI